MLAILWRYAVTTLLLDVGALAFAERRAVRFASNLAVPIKGF